VSCGAAKTRGSRLVFQPTPRIQAAAHGFLDPGKIPFPR
jgi:hypothetical protein